MVLNFFRTLYEENKKTFKIIFVLLIILLFLKVVVEVRNGVRVSKTHHLYADGTEGYAYRDILLTTYEDYTDYIEGFNIEVILNKEDFNKNDYIMYFIEPINCEETYKFDDLKLKSNKIVLYFDYSVDCDRECNNEYDIFLIPISKNIYTELPEVEVEYNNTSDIEYCDGVMIDKPILYLYPTYDMNVSVRLEDSSVIKTSYPKYNNGWNVYALKDGSLYDSDSKYYYALYWDEYSSNKVDFSEGFYVTKDNALEFLEEKLSIIGLNDRERNEFIMYWLPKLEDNRESLVYFELTNEREGNNKLIISPSPDSILRVNMHVKKVDGYVDIKEEELVSFERVGFTVVEWGGTIY